MNNFYILIIILIIIIIFVYLTDNKKISHSKKNKMRITSVFKNYECIPKEYTCDGEGIAPIINIFNVPKNTEELILIVDDPDAPIKESWVHWVLYNLPSNINKIDKNNLPINTKEGINDFGNIGWGGPCPPKGQAHRYFFKLYAINKKLDIQDKQTRAMIDYQMKDNIIECAELVGLYKKL